MGLEILGEYTHIHKPCSASKDQCGLTFGVQAIYPTESNPQSLAAISVNHDEYTDIVVANSGSNSISIFLNLGNSSFVKYATYPVGSNPVSVTAADVNNDNKSDIIVASNGAVTIGVLLSQGNSTFAAQISYSTVHPPNSVVTSDINVDGALDIIIIHYSQNSMGVLLNRGNGTFAAEQTYSTGPAPLYAAAADVNNDGKPDVIVPNSGTSNIGVFLNVGNGTFGSQTVYYTGYYPKFIATADVNSDGKIDVIVPRTSVNGVSVLLNAGGGSFPTAITYPTGVYPFFAATTDFNHDGKPDIVVANTNSYSVSVLLNMGNGSFNTQTTYPTVSNSRHLVVFDINNDNETDMVVTNLNTNNIVVLLNAGNNALTVPSTYSTASSPVSVTAADINNDNQTDVIVANRDTNNIGVFLNKDNGTFSVQKTYATDTSPKSVTASDVNDDKELDIIVANSGSNSISIFLNLGNGSFNSKRTYSVGSNPVSVTAADVNNDSKSDLIVANNGANSISILLNEGNGTFASQTTYATDSQPNSVTAGDINGDGKIDIIVTNENASNVGVFLNKGNGTFANQTAYTVGSQPMSVVVTDVNSDGTLDIVVGNFGSNTISVLVNTGNGTFSTQTTYSTGFGPLSLTAADMNYDNRIDVILVNSLANSISVLYNLGNGTFLSEVVYSTCSWPSSLAIADVTGDGRPEIITTHQGVNSIGVFPSLPQITAPTSNTQSTDATVTSTAHAISSTMVTTLETSSNNQGCSSPTVTVIPETSTLLSPIQYYRSEDFSITSIIKFNCNQSLSTKTQWKIKICYSACSYEIQLDPAVKTTFSELYIPKRTLPYGLYELNLTVTMMNISRLLRTSSVVYIQIISSDIIVNLIKYGTLMITQGFEEDLQLNPGKYSIDPDEETFNNSNWKYKYYCRIYGLYEYPQLNNSLLTIDDVRNDPLNPSCLSNRTGWRFDNKLNSSFTILSDSLQPNRTYQFMVQMENIRNSSNQAVGYVFVNVVNADAQIILIGCVISTLCQPNVEYQFINPTTQMALFSECLQNCTLIENITWNVYYGRKNSSSNFTEWILFNETAFYQNIWFFGTNTSNFTAINQLFLSNPQNELWRCEVVYTFPSGRSSSSLNFLINQPPSNGSCSINPSSGTTSTIFQISCFDWFDNDGIQDYTVYSLATNQQIEIFIAYSTIPIFEILLPMGNNQTSSLNLIIHIRDKLEGVTKKNISSVFVQSDTKAIDNLMNDIQNSSEMITANPIIQLLESKNQNIVGQILISLSLQLNQINNEYLNTAISNGIPKTMISVSPLNSITNEQLSLSFNQSSMNIFQEKLNLNSIIREYLIKYFTQIPLTTSNSVKLQASTLAQFTQSTNELTRISLTFLSNRCYQIAQNLHSRRTILAFEDVQLTVTYLLQCATNLLTAVNSPLQQRTPVLNLDSLRATAFPDDYDTNLDFQWANLKLFADGNDFSWETIEKNRVIYFQEQLANEIHVQMTEVISLISSIINIHLNIEQQFNINTSEVFMTLESRTSEHFSEKFVQQIGNNQIQLPNHFQSYLNNNNKVFIRFLLQPLSIFGNSKISSNTNLSRTISFSLFNINQEEIPIQTNLNETIEIFISRDPNLIIPSMILQNVTSMNSTMHRLLFDLHYLNITTSLPISIHWQIQPINSSISYLFIYKFDQIPQLNSSINQIDGWTIFCPSNLTNEGIYEYFLNNQQTIDHQSIVYGIRELNSTEINERCSNFSMNTPPITNQPFHFTFDYQLRIFTSGCYYLDSNNQWQTNGLIVS
ncbi:unnamed protein product [Adineta ricciae]|uniref:PKD/REJ-like domain-containing protein n=1 Tax=Adineta ricciae TaxID=249248 RepID=A0A815QW07_ADIRI|nr:unnamed protein product [Adineta ricciae]